MAAERITKPCEYCGEPVTKTRTEQGQRKYWTCNASCANKLRIKIGNTPNWNANPLRGQRDTRPCAVCGQSITRYLSKANSERPWTCSRGCQARQRTALAIEAGTWKQPQKPRRGDTKPCEVCAKPVYATATMRAKGLGRYCSQRCVNVAQAKAPVIKNCPTCGKELRLKPSKSGITYCSKSCEGLARIKRPTGEIHNGRPIKTDKAGYRMVWEPSHPNKSMNGWQYEHRLIMEKKLGRYLRPDEHVDHINRDKSQNSEDNLQVLSQNDHARKSSGEYRGDVDRWRSAAERYEQRFGPLPEQE